MTNHNQDNVKVILPSMEESACQEADFNSIRPRSFSDFAGQKEAITCLQTYCQAAKSRNRPLDHVLIYGSSGLGKTTLAYITACQTESNFRLLAGHVIENTDEMASFLTDLDDGDVAVIEGIHCLNKGIVAVLSTAMEECAIDLAIGKGTQAKFIRLDLPRFTLIGVTNRVDGINSAFRSRFGIQIGLRQYSVEELKEVVSFYTRKMNIPIDDDSIGLIAEMGRGNPRETRMVLKRVYDFALVLQNGVITNDLTKKALGLMEATGLKKTN